MVPDHDWGVSGPNADTLSAVSGGRPGMDDGRFRRKADIVRRWREMAGSRMGHSTISLYLARPGAALVHEGQRFWTAHVAGL
jgi:hypothetical protein